MTRMKDEYYFKDYSYYFSSSSSKANNMVILESVTSVFLYYKRDTCRYDPLDFQPFSFSHSLNEICKEIFIAPRG